jgi:hypothetical protein
MVFTILLNKSNNVDNGFKNIFRYRFVGNGLTLDSAKNNYLALASISMPYSIFNISSNFNNNMYQVIHNGVTYTNNISDSFLDIDGLNKQLQYFLISNNLYLINDAGEYVYYIEFVLNAPIYKVEIKFYVVPSVLPSGWTNPGSMALTGTTMQLVIPSTNLFYKILGLIPQSYPASPSAIQVTQLSNTQIELSPISSINLACNLISNDVSVTPQIFYSFTIPNGVSFGEIISVSPSELIYVNCNPGAWSELLLSVVDEFGRPIQLQDNTCVFMLAFKSEKIPKD